MGNNLNVHNPVIEDRCDLVEINHVYNTEGKHVFDQCIWYNLKGKWLEDLDKKYWGYGYDVVAWKMIKNKQILPVKNHRTGLYVQRFYDGRYLRKIVSSTYKETWTQYDPELLERRLTPVELRIQLRK